MFDYHRFSFWHGNPRLFLKDTAWLRIDITTALRDYGLLAQVRGLVCSAVTSRVYTFSIALSKYSLYPSRSPAVSFLKAVFIRA